MKKNFLEPREQKLRRKMGKNWSQLLQTGPFILHDNVAHTSRICNQKTVVMGEKSYLIRPIVQKWVHQTSTYSQS